MSADQNEYLINNGRRYEVTIPKYSREQDYILYEAIILDTAFSLPSTFSFRFKTLKKLHEQMIKQKTNDALPEFPRTKSFALWNRTNEDPKMIQERIRDLEYYLTKLLNSSHLQDLREMQLLRKAICSSRPQRRLSAEVKLTRSEKEIEKPRLKECP